MLSGQATSGEILLDSLKLAENIRSTVNKEEKADGLCSMSTNSCRNRNRAIYSLHIPRSNGVNKTISLALSAKQCLVQDLFCLEVRQ